MKHSEDPRLLCRCLHVAASQCMGVAHYSTVIKKGKVSRVEKRRLYCEQRSSRFQSRIVALVERLRQDHEDAERWRNLCRKQKEIWCNGMRYLMRSK